MKSMGLLEEFFKTGSLGPISIRISCLEVEELLGKPEGVLVGSKDPTIHKYESLQLSYYQGSLYGIKIIFLGELPELSYPLFEAFTFPVPLLEQSAFLKWMNRNNMPFREQKELIFDDQYSVLTEAGVDVGFLEGTLNSISLFCLPQKQKH